MKIVRKERIDVKKYMEDMKINKTATKRTFASVQERTTHPNQRFSRDRHINQYDNYSNNSMPQFSRPAYRNQSFMQGNSRQNIYNQFDIMSQTSQNYRQSYVSPPPMIVPQVNPNLYYNQMPTYYGSSQFPHNQFLYQNVNHSNQINSYDYPQMKKVISQMNTQSFQAFDQQERQNVNSKPQLINEHMESARENNITNTNSLQVITVKKQPIQEQIVTQVNAHNNENNKNIIEPKRQEQYKVVFKQQQKVVKKKRGPKRKIVKQKQDDQKLLQKTKQMFFQIQISQQVNKQFEQKIERQRRAEGEQYQKEKICKNILFLLDNKLRDSFSNLNWGEVSQQLQRKSNQIKKIDLSGKKSVKKHFSDTLNWLQKLQKRLELE